MRYRSLLILVAGVACGGDSATAPVSLAGTYTLRTVNGTPVPVTIAQDAAIKVDLIAGTVFLYSTDSIYIGTSRQRTVSGQAPELDTHTARGRYTRVGATITTTADDASASRRTSQSP